MRSIIRPSAALLGLILLYVPAGASAGVCQDAAQGKVARADVERLCRGAADTDAPARCYAQVMSGRVDWGGSTQWQPPNALDLCEGSHDAQATLSCFRAQVASGKKWNQAIPACDERSAPAAKDAVTTTRPVLDQTTAQVLGASTEPDICWKDSHVRGAGVVPASCPPGSERTGADLLCYPTCRTGYSGIGPVCWQSCPSDFRNDGALCAKPEAYGRGAGYPWKVGDPLNDTEMFARCEGENGRGRCEKDGLVVYPKCRAGYHAVGCCICSPGCPADMADAGVSCTKKSYARGAGEGAACPPRQEQDFKGGLCYPACAAGENGVGPVCWTSCPRDFPVSCGAACGVDQAACAQAIMEQIQSSTEVALNVALLVTTAGAGNAGVKAAKIAGKAAQKSLSKVARDQLKQQAKDQAERALRLTRQAKRIDGQQKWLDKAENLESYSEMMVDTYEKGEFDFTQLAPSAADADLTGVLAVVNAFNKPICGH